MIILMLQKMRYVEDGEVKGGEDNDIENDLLKWRKMMMRILRRRTDFKIFLPFFLAFIKYVLFIYS